MAFPAPFLLWPSARDGDIAGVAACLRDLEGGHVDDSCHGWTPLLKATENNHADVVGLLIGVQANVNAATQHGRNAASVAVAPPNGRAPAADALLLLVQARADLSAPSGKGWPPVTYAMETHATELAYALAEPDPVLGLADFLRARS